MRIDLTARRYSSGPPPGVGDLWLCSSPLRQYLLCWNLNGAWKHYEFLKDTKFRHNRSRDTARGLPVLHCLGGDAYWFLVGDVLGRKPHLLDLGDRPEAKFCKNSLKGVYPFWTNLYQKTPILAILGAVLLHFLTHIHEIWHEGANLGLPPPSYIL